jgi:hypothetical protein
MVSKPSVNQHFLSFFIRPERLMNSVLPMIRTQGIEFGMQ